MFNTDDGSGRQKWKLEPLGDGSFMVSVSDGVGDQRYLSNIAPTASIRLSIKDSRAASQRWRLWPAS
jgi:hypothetical protein